MTASSTVVIQVNGEPREALAGTTVSALLGHMNLNLARIAVEYNRSILPRDRWTETTISAGDQFEIVQFVGGG